MGLRFLWGFLQEFYKGATTALGIRGKMQLYNVGAWTNRISLRVSCLGFSSSGFWG